MLINGAMRFAYHALLQSKPALDFHEAVFFIPVFRYVVADQLYWGDSDAHLRVSLLVCIVFLFVLYLG